MRANLKKKKKKPVKQTRNNVGLNLTIHPRLKLAALRFAADDLLSGPSELFAAYLRKRIQKEA